MKFEVIFRDCGDNETIVSQKFDTFEDADKWASDLECDFQDIDIDENGNDYWKTFYRYYNPEDTENYVGYELFSSFPENMSIKKKLNHFKDIDFIPKELSGIIIKEDIEKYLKIENLIEVHKFDLKTTWSFLNAPVKKNNEDVFSELIYCYSKNKIINPPYVQEHYFDAKQLEDIISEVELYINLTRHLNHDPIELDKTKNKKEFLIEKLTEFIMNKKLLNKKKCKLCTNLLEITYPYPYCNSCYEDKVRGDYNWW